MLRASTTRSRWPAVALLLALATAPAAWPQTQRPVDSAEANQPSDGFGRWESALSRCHLQLGPPKTPSSCLSMRLDQSIEGMLRVRFINAGGSSRFGSQELTFAGLLLLGDEPMHCRQGQCAPSWPMRIQVHGVGRRSFDGRGLAERLPTTQLAKGSCRLGPRQVYCQAEAPGGLSWQASADLPAAAPTRAASSKRP